MQPRRQGGTSLPDLRRADQPEGRILRQPHGIVHVFVSGQAAVDGLAQQIEQWQLRILTPPVVGLSGNSDRTMGVAPRRLRG